jgi:hypothetical protein
MTGITARRWTDAGTTWFAISGVGPELAPKAGVDVPWPADFGPVAASRLETVTWESWQLRVPPLDLQRAVSQRRGLTARVALIDALLN